jgi:hypothetical protein
MRTTVYLDEESRAVIDSFPRQVTMSSIMRCLLQAAVATEEDWKELLKNEPDIARAREAIKEKMKAVGKGVIVL